MLVGSVLVTPVALYVVFLMAGGACPRTAIPQVVVFPYAMMVGALPLLGQTERVDDVTFILAVLQVPLYGFFLALGLWRSRIGWTMIVLAVAHVVAAFACLFWELHL
jgi:hypothetical protein